MNNYDELIKALRADAMFQRNRFSRDIIATEMELASDALEQLQAENISLRAERDALLKSFTVTSQPIEVIQPKGVVE